VTLEQRRKKRTSKGKKTKEPSRQEQRKVKNVFAQCISIGPGLNKAEKTKEAPQARKKKGLRKNKIKPRRRKKERPKPYLDLLSLESIVSWTKWLNPRGLLRWVMVEFTQGKLRKKLVGSHVHHFGRDVGLFIDSDSDHTELDEHLKKIKTVFETFHGVQIPSLGTLKSKETLNDISWKPIPKIHMQDSCSIKQIRAWTKKEN
jgi:hypothetical protein